MYFKQIMLHKKSPPQKNVCCLVPFLKVKEQAKLIFSNEKSKTVVSSKTGL